MWIQWDDAWLFEFWCNSKSGGIIFVAMRFHVWVLCQKFELIDKVACVTRVISKCRIILWHQWWTHMRLKKLDRINVRTFSYTDQPFLLQQRAKGWHIRRDPTEKCAPDQLARWPDRTFLQDCTNGCQKLRPNWQQNNTFLTSQHSYIVGLLLPRRSLLDINSLETKRGLVKNNTAIAKATF